MNGTMRSASVAMTPGVTADGIVTPTGLYPRCFSRLKGIVFDKPHLKAQLRETDRSVARFAGT